MTYTILPIEQIQGFFDADGSFEAKVRRGSVKPLSFHVNIIFSQEDEPMLQAVLGSINAKNTKGQKEKTISERNIVNDSGSQSIARSVSIAFSSNGGQTLLEAWAKHPPIAPTKLLDYRISLILAQVSESQTSTALDVVTKHLKPNSPLVPGDELTAGLALLWLRFRMFGKVKSNKNPNLLPIEHFYSETNASKAQISQSIAIGKQLFAPIEEEFNQHSANLLNYQQNTVNISQDYLLGYHMGDGSFQIQTEFRKNNSSFKCRFRWTLTDCAENKPLLEAVKQKLTKEGLTGLKIQSYETYYKLVLSEQGSCKKLVNIWEGKNVPGVRQNQYNCFKEALNLYNLASLKGNLAQAEEIINLKWTMNPRTNYKKAGDLQTDLTKVRAWFMKNKKSSNNL